MKIKVFGDPFIILMNSQMELGILSVIQIKHWDGLQVSFNHLPETNTTEQKDHKGNSGQCLKTNGKQPINEQGLTIFC